MLVKAKLSVTLVSLTIRDGKCILLRAQVEIYPALQIFRLQKTPYVYRAKYLKNDQSWRYVSWTNPIES